MTQELAPVVPARHGGEAAEPVVRHFHQILLWPLELRPGDLADDGAPPWQRLLEDGAAATWREVDDEFPNEPELFQDRHYSEFVTFRPDVRRFLYGEGATRSAGRSRSPIRVLRRTDVRQARLRPSTTDANRQTTAEPD